MARVAATGTRVEADAAVRARDLGEDPSFAIASAEALIARVEACAEGDRPVEAAFLASARAEQARAAGEDDPDLWTAADRRLAGARASRTAPRRRCGARPRRSSRAASARPPPRAPPTRWPPRRRSARRGSSQRSRASRCARGLRLEPDESSPAPALTATDAGEDPFGLTPRERQVLALLADGRTNREIGSALYMAEKTASVHVSRILSKLDVRSRTEAAALAHRVGLV